MPSKEILNGKMILVVDDEIDIIDTVAEARDMCIIRKAQDDDTAVQYLLGFTFDVVILDIMGVNGFELLKTSVSRGFPTVMLTAHALSPDALKKSIKLGAVSFLPKEKITELKPFLEDVVLEDGKPVWKRLFDKLGSYFDNRFGSDWKERDHFFKEFQDARKRDKAVL